MRVESRFIMVRNAPHGRGTVYLTDCSGKPVSKRLGSVHSRTYVTAQLTAPARDLYVGKSIDRRAVEIGKALLVAVFRW